MPRITDSIGAIEQTTVCVPLMVSQAHTADGYTKAPYQAVATARFVVEECVAPTAPVAPDEIIDIKIVYKWCDLLIYDPHNEIARWPQVQPDGAEVWCLISGPFGACFKRFLYLWKLAKIYLYLNGSLVQTINRLDTQPGSEFAWTFHGTIEEFLGRKVTEPEIVTLMWEIGYEVMAGVNVEWWPWEAPVKLYFDEYISEISLSNIISVYIPPPPPPPPPSYPTFVPDLCGLSITPTTPVAPNQKFNIKVTIENQSESSGSYVIGYYCEANYEELVTGTIGGSPARKNHTFSVTPNQLAHRSITESQVLYFVIVVENEEGTETDRWTPAGISVIVTPPPPPTANLSGLVTDKQTGAGLAGVSVTTAGSSTSTNSSGSYTLTGLEPGSYSIKFSKAGYWDETKSKTLVSGQNTLNVAMTSSTEPEPGEIPWALIGAGALGIVGVVLIASGAKKGAGK